MPEYSVVPYKWVDEMNKIVYVPPNKFLTTCKDPMSMPDNTWLKRELIKVVQKNIATQLQADEILDEIIDKSESDADILPSDAKKRRINTPKILPRQQQYTL